MILTLPLGKQNISKISIDVRQLVKYERIVLENSGNILLDINSSFIRYLLEKHFMTKNGTNIMKDYDERYCNIIGGGSEPVNFIKHLPLSLCTEHDVVLKLYVKKEFQDEKRFKNRLNCIDKYLCENPYFGVKIKYDTYPHYPLTYELDIYKPVDEEWKKHKFFKKIDGMSYFCDKLRFMQNMCGTACRNPYNNEM